MKKISIVVPCYNVEQYIDQCLESLVHQTIGVDSLELILVNDASTDNTLEHLLAYEKKYPESVMVVACEENHRQGAARNIGFTYATADYVGYVDADDWCEPDMYERMYEKAVETDCDAVLCQYMRDDGTRLVRREPEKNHLVELKTDEEVSSNLAFRFFGQSACVTLSKRSFLKDNEIVFAENIFYEDNLWTGLFHIYIRKAYIMEEELYHYRVNPHSTVSVRNSDRHFDALFVALMTWEEFDRRGLMSRYRQGIEYDFIRMFYFFGLKMLALWFDNPSYEVFLGMINTLKEVVPDGKNNIYVEVCTNDLCRRLLNIADMHPSEEDFRQLMEIVRQSGI